MVTGRRISELRKSGRLDEAYELACREHARDPEDEWVTGALSWVLYDQLKLVRADAARGRLDAPRCARVLREVAALRLPEQGNDVFYRNLHRLLESLVWDVRDALGADGLRTLLATLTETTRVVSDVAWRADAAGAGEGLLALPRSVAKRMLRAFLAGLGGSPGDGALGVEPSGDGARRGESGDERSEGNLAQRDLAALVAWSGEESFALAEDVRRGVPADAPGGGDALSSLPRIPIYVEWTSPSRGALGITAYRRSVAQGYGPPTASLERSVVVDRRLAGLLAAHEVYDAVLSPDGRAILGTPSRCDDEGVRASFIRPFEGTFERIGSFGFVRLPGGTSATGDVLVPRRLVERHGIANLSQVRGTAVAAFREAGEKDAGSRASDDAGASARAGAEKDAGSWGFVADAIERVVPPSAEDVARHVRGTVRVARSGAVLVEGVLVPRRMAAELGLRAGQEVEVVARRSWDRRRRAWGWIARSAQAIG